MPAAKTRNFRYRILDPFLRPFEIHFIQLHCYDATALPNFTVIRETRSCLFSLGWPRPLNFDSERDGDFQARWWFSAAKGQLPNSLEYKSPWQRSAWLLLRATGEERGPWGSRIRIAGRRFTVRIAKLEWRNRPFPLKSCRPDRRGECNRYWKLLRGSTCCQR